MLCQEGERERGRERDQERGRDRERERERTGAWMGNIKTAAGRREPTSMETTTPLT